MIEKIQNGDRVNEIQLLVKRADKKKTKNGDDYYELELADASGVIGAKIWNNKMIDCQFEVGKIVQVEAVTQEYQGKLSLILSKSIIINNAEAKEFSPRVPTLIFDLETAGQEFDNLDEVQKDYLLNNLEKNTEDKEEAKKRMALYSIFGQICAVGMMDFYDKKGIVLLRGKGEVKPENENFEYFVFETEKDLLIKFWEIAEKYKLFVTYNGTGFDFPYLTIRSGVNRVRIPFELKKYGNEHIDLQTRLGGQYNRGYKLEQICKAFGVENPKGEGVDGGAVDGLFKTGEYKQIADYVARDAVATTEVYRIWKEYLSGEI